MRRGLYGKRELRAASLPPAWQVGDRKSFMAARAQALWAILRDHHMNPNELWSSFASIPKIAEKSGVSESGCWKAIKRADGKTSRPSGKVNRPTSRCIRTSQNCDL